MLMPFSSCGDQRRPSNPEPPQTDIRHILGLFWVLCWSGPTCPPRFHSPSPRQEVHFDKRVRVAVIVPRGKVPGLQDMNNQVAELLVIVDLKLRRDRAGFCSCCNLYL